MLETFIGSRRATYPLLILAIILYGLFDALTTLLCYYMLSGHGYNALDSEISPLIRSGIFGSDWRAVVLSKVCVMAFIFLHLYILSQFQQLVPVVNACLITMTVFGTVATVNNINIVLGGAEITFFNISPVMICAMLSSLILLFGFLIFLTRMREETYKAVN
jgi:hypothetical protein